MNGEKIISGCNDTLGRLWSLEDGTWNGTTFEAHTNIVDKVSFSDDVLLSWSCNDGTLRINVPDVVECKGALVERHIIMVNTIAVSREGTRMVSDGDYGNVILWELVAKKCIPTLLKRHTEKVTSVAIGSNGLSVASGSTDGKVYVCISEDGEWITHLLGVHSHSVHAMANCEDEYRVFYGGYDGMLGVWDHVRGSWFKRWIIRHTNPILLTL